MILDKIEKEERAEELFEIKENAQMVSDILKELADELEKRDDLLALSAPQIGHNYRIFALKFKDKIQFFFNPLNIKSENLTLSRETCITCGPQSYLIPRFNDIKVSFMQPTGLIREVELNGTAAFLFQQMFQILDCVYLSDWGFPVDDDFFDLPKDVQNDILKEYLDNVSKLSTDINDEIKNDAELRGIKDTIDFMTSVAKGETEVKQVEYKPNRKERRRRAKLAKKIMKQMQNQIKDVTPDGKESSD